MAVGDVFVTMVIVVFMVMITIAVVLMDHEGAATIFLAGTRFEVWRYLILKVAQYLEWS